MDEVVTFGEGPRGMMVMPPAEGGGVVVGGGGGWVGVEVERGVGVEMRGVAVVMVVRRARRARRGRGVGCIVERVRWRLVCLGRGWCFWVEDGVFGLRVVML